MTKEIKVNNEVTMDIQRKDMARQIAQETLHNITNEHIGDSDASFVKSPVYKELQKDAEEKRIAWDRAKDEMVQEYIPEDMQNQLRQWTLDYATSTLFVEV